LIILDAGTMSHLINSSRAIIQIKIRYTSTKFDYSLD